MMTGTTKTLLTLAILTQATIFPISGNQTLTMILWISIASFLLGLILTSIMQYNSLYNRLTIERPKWADKITLKNPLTYIQLIGFVLLAAGVGGLLGGLIKWQAINFIGTVLLTAGLGTLTGLYIELARKKNKISEQSATEDH